MESSDLSQIMLMDHSDLDNKPKYPKESDETPHPDHSTNDNNGRNNSGSFVASNNPARRRFRKWLNLDQIWTSINLMYYHGFVNFINWLSESL